MDTLHGQKKEKYFGNISFIQYDEMGPKKTFQLLFDPIHFQQWQEKCLLIQFRKVDLMQLKELIQITTWSKGAGPRGPDITELGG